MSLSGDIRGRGQVRPFGVSMRDEFRLDVAAVHLNHGGFGAAPRAVSEAQSRWRERIERAAGPFFQWELSAELRKQAAKLADYIGAAADDLVFVENATSGLMAVLGSQIFGPTDEILVTNQTYPAVRNIALHAAERSGASVVCAELPFPVEHPDEVVAAFASCLTERTRLAIVDHVTSPTAICMPISRLIAACRQAGVRVLIDGAHAPGMVSLDVAGLGADWYVGNCHKWLFAPRGCAFLWASSAAQRDLRPPVVSHAWKDGFTAAFAWTGTRDVSAYLALEAALEFRRSCGERRIVEHNHGLVCEGAEYLVRQWRSRIGAPRDHCGAMAAVELAGFAGDENAAARLRRVLWEKARVDVPILSWRGRFWTRLSAQIYNVFEDYEALAHAIAALDR
jgi:isopenicillin-N epimerase